MAAGIVSAEIIKARLHLVVCPTAVNGACACPAAASHVTMAFGPVPAESVAAEAWMARCAADARRLVEAEATAATSTSVPGLVDTSMG